jgi:hypothetical protein
MLRRFWGKYYFYVELILKVPHLTTDCENVNMKIHNCYHSYYSVLRSFHMRFFFVHINVIQFVNFQSCFSYLIMLVLLHILGRFRFSL